MSENKHTPEPWYVVDKPWGNGTWINSGSPDPHHEGFVADCEDMNGDVDKDTARINARRITACVNACEGIPTDALERSKSLDEFMRSMKVIEQQRDSFKDAAEYNKRRAEDAEKQRDELLDELEKAASYHASHECYSEAKRVRAFIASVKGEQ